MTDDERRKLVSTEQPLSADPSEARLPSWIAGLETFTLNDGGEEKEAEERVPDAESFFNLPDDGDEDEKSG